VKNILVVGGAGYIGSHTVKALNKAGYTPVVFDNLSSGHKEAVAGSKLITGELADKEQLVQVLKEENITAVMHFAGKIDAAESVHKPLEYLKANCFDGVSLLLAMQACGVKNIIFSSTAAVYGDAEKLPITEDAPKQPTNPYGLSKLLFEEVLQYYEQQAQLRYVSLRYFNAAGADMEGELGDDHASKTHLITSAILTALGDREKLKLFGTDYPTPDGTCIRDYIHVDDLAEAHVLALDYLLKNNQSAIFNLGSENGFSNKQVIEAVKEISGVDFTVEEVARRKGDPAALLASAQAAREVLGWKVRHSDLETIIRSAYNWQKNHPEGYQPSA